jgi:ribosomal protein S18 acetylase RimI-like enzyme
MSLSHHLLLSIAIVVLNIVALHHSGILPTTDALVATSPRWVGKTTTRSRDETRNNVGSIDKTKNTIVQTDLVIKIRSTTHDDIHTVATILSHALLETGQRGHRPTLINFKQKMEFLKTRAGVVSLLQSRIDAITVGNRFWRNRFSSDNFAYDHGNYTTSLSDAQKLRFIWSNDAFRAKLEKAAKLSDEPHVWKGHNFACAPSSSVWLCHKMLTAENGVTGEIVGFCEVAMLRNPTTDFTVGDDGDEERNETVPVPTIINLVTSANYRRRGVASSILKSATRFVQQAWSSNELALYVEQSNAPAVRMYEALGFEMKQELVSSQYYMTTSL